MKKIIFLIMLITSSMFSLSDTLGLERVSVDNWQTIQQYRSSIYITEIDSISVEKIITCSDETKDTIIEIETYPKIIKVYNKKNVLYGIYHIIYDEDYNIIDEVLYYKTQPEIIDISVRK